MSDETAAAILVQTIFDHNESLRNRIVQAKISDFPDSGAEFIKPMDMADLVAVLEQLKQERDQAEGRLRKLDAAISVLSATSALGEGARKNNKIERANIKRCQGGGSDWLCLITTVCP
jgi:hypothetical protein